MIEDINDECLTLLAEDLQPRNVEPEPVRRSSSERPSQLSDTIRRRNPRMQGLIGVGDAIHWFIVNGYCVSIPVNDSQPYDLVVDGGERLERVQVKTTTCRSPAGRFIVQLETRGGNQSFNSGKKFDPAAADLLYVLTDDSERYVIPTKAIAARSGLTLGPRLHDFRV